VEIAPQRHLTNAGTGKLWPHRLLLRVRSSHSWHHGLHLLDLVLLLLLHPEALLHLHLLLHLEPHDWRLLNGHGSSHHLIQHSWTLLHHLLLLLLHHLQLSLVPRILHMRRRKLNTLRRHRRSMLLLLLKVWMLLRMLLLLLMVGQALDNGMWGRGGWNSLHLL
jgi:hypothetical protein